jgi:hypothetical protein
MSRTKNWGELSPTRQRVIVLGTVVQFSLAIAAWWDLAHRSDESVRGSKRFWAVAILINFVGPIAYFARGRRVGPAAPREVTVPGPSDGSPSTS